jgi:thiol-disulfide isomerase/thioredoxin
MKDSRIAMRLAVAWLGLMAAGVTAASALAAPARSVGAMLANNVGTPPPALERALTRKPLQMLDGSRLAIASLDGQVVVLNFWATWCRRCLHELPVLDAMNRDIAARGGRVVAISMDEDRRNVERFVRAHTLRLPIAYDGPSGMARELDLKQVPLTLVLDRRGTVAWCSSRTDEKGLAETRAAVERLLSAPIPPRSDPAVTVGDAR